MYTRCIPVAHKVDFEGVCSLIIYVYSAGFGYTGAVELGHCIPVS